jgi:CheY-like chemotaxis protein
MHEAPSAEILIIDDDAELRGAVAEALEQCGFRVATAGNGREGLDLLRQGKVPRLILLDLMMPVMNGWQFRRAQAQDPRLADIPVIVVTAAGAREDIPAIDATAWLSKPVDFDRLLATIGSFCPRD